MGEIVGVRGWVVVGGAWRAFALWGVIMVRVVWLGKAVFFVCRFFIRQLARLALLRCSFSNFVPAYDSSCAQIASKFHQASPFPFHTSCPPRIPLVVLETLE